MQGDPSQNHTYRNLWCRAAASTIKSIPKAANKVDCKEDEVLVGLRSLVESLRGGKLSVQPEHAGDVHRLGLELSAIIHTMVTLESSMDPPQCWGCWGSDADHRSRSTSPHCRRPLPSSAPTIRLAGDRDTHHRGTGLRCTGMRSKLAPGTSEWTVTSAKPAVVRAGCELSSARWGEVLPGNVVVVHEFVDLPDATRRARTDAGWLTAVSKDGHLKLAPVPPSAAAPPTSAECCRFLPSKSSGKKTPRTPAAGIPIHPAPCQPGSTEVTALRGAGVTSSRRAQLAQTEAACALEPVGAGTRNLQPDANAMAMILSDLNGSLQQTSCTGAQSPSQVIEDSLITPTQSARASIVPADPANTPSTPTGPANAPIAPGHDPADIMAASTRPADASSTSEQACDAPFAYSQQVHATAAPPAPPGVGDEMYLTCPSHILPTGERVDFGDVGEVVGKAAPGTRAHLNGLRLWVARIGVCVDLTLDQLSVRPPMAALVSEPAIESPTDSTSDSPHDRKPSAAPPKKAAPLASKPEEAPAKEVTAAPASEGSAPPPRQAAPSAAKPSAAPTKAVAAPSTKSSVTALSNDGYPNVVPVPPAAAAPPITTGRHSALPSKPSGKKSPKPPAAREPVLPASARSRTAAAAKTHSTPRPSVTAAMKPTGSKAPGAAHASVHT